MDTPIVLTFYIKLSSNSIIIRSIVLKEYFSKLTSNVEVLYPTQIHCGLLLCKSKRTEEKILNMRHILSNGSTIHLSHLNRSLFQQIKCTISGQIMQLNDMSILFQQCLPFLHASDGKIQVNPDGSILLEGHIFILNSIHSFLTNKASKKKDQSNNTNLSETLNLHSKNIDIKIMSGKLIEQNVESIIIPMSDKYNIHKAFDRQIQSLGGTTIINHLKELKTKNTHSHEGDIILFSNHGLKIPANILIFFTVLRLSNNTVIKDKSMIDSFQPTYEKLIYNALQTIEQNNITNIAMPILEPHVKLSCKRLYANEMAVRAMISAIRQYSQNLSIKLKRIIIVDHQIQIKQMNKYMKKYQKQIEKTITINNDIDLDSDDGHSFTYIFGVPKVPEIISSTSESDDDIELEDYQFPYKHHTKI
ncbi:unnamed protein product [Rotaria sordida]|uniref:Macro domain-containing protein n=1 Tax=Rotaria sordida TaxID=392033 RepID=A0A813UP41_9BILA|nr:unnamed protein product [Rotaria sordida]CAF0834466.1 unnamed protein product [Rotaria sordida]